MTTASPKRVWLHLPDKFDGAVVEQLCEAIFEQAPGVEILLSAATVPPDALNHHGDCVALPRDNAQGGVEFIKTWQPTVGIWLDGELNPNLLKACANAHVPMHLVDSGSAHKAAKGGMFQRLLGGSALRHFLSVTVGDAKTERALRRAGAAHGTIQTVGLFEKSRPCLPVNEAELDYFAELLSTRPIWLAAQINLVELDVILAAFQQVSRRAHRLILIIVPSDLRDADAGVKRSAPVISFSAANTSPGVCKRSSGDLAISCFNNRSTAGGASDRNSPMGRASNTTCEEIFSNDDLPEKGGSAASK